MLIRCEFVEEEKGKNERNICQENNWREEGEGRGDWRLQTAREGVKTQTDRHYGIQPQGTRNISVTVQCQGDPVAPEFSLRRGDSNFVKPAIIPLYSLQEIKETFNE